MKADLRRIGVSLGLTAAIIQIIWQILVAVGVAQSLLYLGMSLKSIDAQVAVVPFNLGVAVVSVIVTFVIAYIVGAIFAMSWNRTKSRG